MSKLCSTRFGFAALTLAAGVHVTNPTFAQNINDLLTIFGGDGQRAARQAQADWRRVPPAELACIDQRLRRQGSSVEALVRRAVKPSAARLIELRSSCREFVESVQTGTASALRGAAGSPAPTVPVGNPTEPKDAGVTSPSLTESAKDAGVTPPSSAESVERAVENQVQQGNVELRDSFPESGIVGWLSKAFLVAVVAMVMLLGVVVYLFIRWHGTGQRTVVASTAANHVQKKNLERGEEQAPSDITIGRTGEAVMPVADKMTQLRDQIGASAAISISQNSSHSSKVESTGEQMLPYTASIETSEASATGGSALENVAQLAKLYALRTPSEKEFQLLKELIARGSSGAKLT